MIAFLLSSGSVAASDNHANAEAVAASLGATAWREVDSLPDAPQEQWVWTNAGALGVATILTPATKAARIAELKQLLADTDYVALSDYDKDKAEVITQRAAWRTELRGLEA